MCQTFSFQRDTTKKEKFIPKIYFYHRIPQININVAPYNPLKQINI